MMPTFAYPIYLWMLPALLPLLVLRYRAHRLGQRGTPGLVADRLRGELILGASPWLRWAVFFMNSLALTFIVIALARPQWGFEEVATESEGRNVIIAVDTSRSMLATDLLPDRLTRSKLAAQDLVKSLPNDRIGLIAFAGRAFLQAPLTMDHMAIVETLDQLDTEIIPRGGTNINSAVSMAIETFQKAESKDNALILFSDGEDLEGGEALAKIGKDAENLGLIIVAVGVGTEAGSIIPDPDASDPGVFIKNDSGNIVRSRLDPSALKQLSAKTSRGLYLNLGASNSITDIVGKALEQIEVTRHEDSLKKRPIERFAWALSVALACMIIAFLLPLSIRRSPRQAFPLSPATTSINKASLILLLCILNFHSSVVQAEIPSPAPSDTPAIQSFQDEDYETAVNSYKREIEKTDSPNKQSRLQFGLGSAAYRTGDFELAEKSFGKVLERQNQKGLTTDAHYNLANTLFRHGQALLKPSAPDPSSQSPQAEADPTGAKRQWQAAIEHYQAALESDPEHAPSDENLKIVRQHLVRLEEQQKEEQQKEDQKKEDEEKKDEDEEKEEDKDKDKDKDKGEGEDKDKDKDKGEGEDEDKDKDKGEGDDQKEKSDDPKGNQPPPEDQKNKDGSDKDNQEPPSSDPKNEDGENKKPGEPGDQPDQPSPSPEQNQDNKNGQKPAPEQKGNQEPPKKDPEGNLKANPGSPQPAQPTEGRETKADEQTNPETGFSPLEARRLLQSLSDEDLSVKPLIRRMPAQPFKNW